MQFLKTFKGQNQIAQQISKSYGVSQVSLSNKNSQNFADYVRGFRNTQFLESVPGSLPQNTNPKYGNFNLVTEQVTGPQGFTGEQSANGPLRLWVYKKERSIKIGEYKDSQTQPFQGIEYEVAGPNPIRLTPPSIPSQPTDFAQGLIPIADNDHILHYQYSINRSMSENNRVFHNIDGEMLVQPSVGKIQVITECGILELEPGVIGVITKNIKFQVNLDGCENAQGLITELKNDRSFRVPSKGPIGANGLANPEYFQTPVPYVDTMNLNKVHRVICKKQNSFFEADQQKSPFDVQAWKGNYAPYRFNFDDFVPIIAGQKDHIDPSSHLLLAVGGEDGANVVEIALFAPRYNVTTDGTPTYLPPYDHRNNGKSELMHYLGGYDARLGTTAGSQTIHDMGVAHGNDQATFEKSRTGPNENIFLNHKPATMVEVTNYLRYAPGVLANQDLTYGEQLRGVDAIPSANQRVPEGYVGKMKKITFTAFESSITHIFDVLMPKPTVSYNEKTGITTKQYRNSRGDIFEINSQEDQNRFWDLYKLTSDQQPKFDLSSIAQRDPSQASDEELKIASIIMRSFLNRGTVIQAVDLETEDPEKAVNYFKAKGYSQGVEPNCVTLDPNAPLNFRMIKKGDFDIQPNPEALVSTIDHTVINVFRNQLQKMFDMFPDTFWGGDCRDLRAHGVQFDTRVLSSQLKNVEQLVPVNNLDATEEEILHRIQAGDTYVPPYIRDAAIGNQITRGLMDTNRTTPTASKDAFLQHIAMSVNTKYGDISFHLQNLKDHGLRLIPGPPDAYYELSEVDLGQRVLLPTLFGMAGVEAFELPYTFFNGLLKPKDANVDRLNELLVKDNMWEQADATPVVNAYKQIQPVLELVGNSVQEFNAESFRGQLESTLSAQNLTYTSEQVDTIISLIEFNKKKVARAQEVGSLIDFQIIIVGGNNQSGYLDQTFSVPITQGSEGTSGIFLEFIVRTTYDEIFDLIKQNKFYVDEETGFKCAGAFGQGNFGNLMLGQQLGIKKMDQIQKQKAAASGFEFKMPMLDFETINYRPIEHLENHISQAESRGETDKIEGLQKLQGNIEALIAECKKRGLWE